MTVIAATCRGIGYTYRLGLTPGQLRRFVLTLHGGGGDDGKRIRKNVSPGGPIAI